MSCITLLYSCQVSTFSLLSFLYLFIQECGMFWWIIVLKRLPHLLLGTGLDARCIDREIRWKRFQAFDLWENCLWHRNSWLAYETQDILWCSYGAQLSIAEADVELTLTWEQYLLIMEQKKLSKVYKQIFLYRGIGSPIDYKLQHTICVTHRHRFQLDLER